MPLYALDTILHQGREYQRGDKLPKDFDEETADRFKDREPPLVSDTEPKLDADQVEAIADGDVDYDALKKGELVELADARGLDSSGTADDIRAALVADDAS